MRYADACDPPTYPEERGPCPECGWTKCECEDLALEDDDDEHADDGSTEDDDSLNAIAGILAGCVGGGLLWLLLVVLFLAGCAPTRIRPYSEAELRVLCAPPAELFEAVKGDWL